MDVEITDVETYAVANPWKPWVFVRVETDAGVHGVGEATTHSKTRAVMAAVDELEDRIVGLDPFDTERFVHETYRDEYYSRNIVNTTVIGAIDIACWDVKGKLLDRPLYDLLGGSVHGDELRAYANGWYTDTGHTPEGFAAAAERVVDDGYDALKFDPFGAAWERMDRRSRNHALDIVRAVREAVGPDVDLLIEGHGRFAPGAAVELARDLEAQDPTWFEEPVPADAVDAMRKVTDRSPVPVAAGERLMGKHAFADLLTHTDVDVVQPDLVKSGGVTEAKKVAAMAEAEHVSFAPHNPQGPISTAVCAHVCTSAPNFTIQEVFEDYDVDWKADLLDEPVRVEDGHLQVPRGSGLGVDLDLDAVREHAYTGENAAPMNLFETGWEAREMQDR